MELKQFINCLMLIISVLQIDVNAVPIDDSTVETDRPQQDENSYRPQQDENSYRPIPKARLTNEQIELSNDYLVGSNIPAEGKPYCQSALCNRQNYPVQSVPQPKAQPQYPESNREEHSSNPIDNQDENIYQNVIPLQQHNVNVEEPQNRFDQTQSPQYNDRRTPEGNIGQNVPQENTGQQVIPEQSISQSSPSNVDNTRQIYQYPIVNEDNQRHVPVSYDGVTTGSGFYNYGPQQSYESYEMEYQRLQNIVQYYQQQMLKILANLHSLRSNTETLSYNGDEKSNPSQGSGYYQERTNLRNDFNSGSASASSNTMVYA